MSIKRIALIALAVGAFAFVVSLGVTTYWQKKQATFTGAAKLAEAVQTFCRDLEVHGDPRPSSITLRDLVSRGYLAPNDIRAFEGMDVVLSLENADETTPGELLARVTMSDGALIVMLSDGSIQETTPSKLAAWTHSGQIR